MEALFFLQQRVKQSSELSFLLQNALLMLRRAVARRDLC